MPGPSTASETRLFDDELQDERGAVLLPPAVAEACQRASGTVCHSGSWAALLTGCTGFLGGHVLAEVLRRTGVRPRRPKVAVVVRGDNAKDCADRLWEHCAGLEVDLEPYKKHLVVLASQDLAKPGLGLDEPSQEQLRKLNVRCVMHSAAVLDEYKSYEELRAANVTTTLNMLHFAAQNNAKFNYISDQLPLADPAREDRDCSWEAIDAAQMSGYAQTKWISEQLCLSASREGLPMSILRLPFVVGDSWTGVHQLGHMPARLIASIIELGSAPTDVSLDCVSVDVAAQLVAWVSISTQTRGVETCTGKFVDGDARACVTHVSTTLDKLSVESIVDALWLVGYRHLRWIDRAEWMRQAANVNGRLSEVQRSEHLLHATALVNSLTPPEFARTDGHEEKCSEIQRVSPRCLKRMILYLQGKGVIPAVEVYDRRIRAERGERSEERAGDRKQEETASRVRAVTTAMMRSKMRGGRLHHETRNRANFVAAAA